jgi:hypothetical protein
VTLHVSASWRREASGKNGPLRRNQCSGTRFASSSRLKLHRIGDRSSKSKTSWKPIMVKLSKVSSAAETSLLGTTRVGRLDRCRHPGPQALDPALSRTAIGETGGAPSTAANVLRQVASQGRLEKFSPLNSRSCTQQATSVM